jgi:hypothetical protein
MIGATLESFHSHGGNLANRMTGSHKGRVTLHRCHGHVYSDLRGRREVAGDGIVVPCPEGSPLYPRRCTVSGPEPSDQPSMAKGPGVSQAPLNPRNAPRAVVRWWPHSKGRVWEGIDTESCPRSTFRQMRRPLCARLLIGLEGIRLPLGPLGFINDLNPRAPSATTSPPPDLRHVAQRPVS